MADYRYDPDGDEPGGQGGCFWAVIFLLGIVGIVVALLVAFPDAPGVTFEWPRLVYLLLLLSVVGVSMAGVFRANPGRTLRHVAIWMAIVASLALLYSFRHEFGMARDRVTGNLAPARGVANTTTDGTREVTLFAQSDGHFYAQVEVEGKEILFMVDTGASDIALSRKDADRLGLSPSEREFTRIYQTANGTMRGAPVTLDSVAIGPIDVRNVAASVAEGDMGVSLLGMSFLNRLSGYQVTGDRLTLRQ
ncbi:TIGR02281 family clan AA aspartic protease [Iodidimonas sp. SYSU 1G8]|uniref:retropepsin-like aspartic protease family protein n=1 Tax=Iodidimonas sp. SYSU 1G8 TaxID=3133967 RepID=UPI0031FF16D4